MDRKHKLTGNFKKEHMSKDQKFSQKIYKHSSWLLVYQISSGKNFPFTADLYYNNTPNNFIWMLFLIGSSYHYVSGTESKKYIKSSTMVQNIQKHFDWGNVWESTASPPKKGINGRYSSWVHGL